MKSDLPEAFTEDMRSVLGEEAVEFFNTYDLPAQKGFRVNPFKPSSFVIDNFSDGKIPYVENGYYTACTDLGSTSFHHGGAIYLQEPSAMFPASVLSPHKGAKVLDMCAAPGGKSGQLAEMIGTDGVLVSNEIFRDRCKILLGNVERMGYPNVVVTCLAPKEVADKLKGYFDYVLVDAPCSGEGMFRKNPDAIEEWSPANVKVSAQRQIEILSYAGKCLKTGGRLVYSTCTFSREENEKTVEKFLALGGFELLPCPKEYGVEDGLTPYEYTARLYPHKMKGEGHFTALFVKTEDCASNSAPAPLKELTSKDKKTIKEFCDKELIREPNVKLFGESLVIPPSITPPLDKGVLRYGVKFGDVGDRVTPHHQLFSAYPHLFKNHLNLYHDSDDLKAYLHGDEIETDIANGWCVVEVDGIAIGGAKVSAGRAKNHYPKGLRTKKL